MDPGAWRRTVLALDGAAFLLFVIAAFSGASILILLGALVVVAILWFKGFVRYPRVRRLARNVATATVQLARTHRLTRKQTRNLLVSIGILVLLIVLNQLRLALPGKGRGISIPLEAFSLDFSGLSGEGSVFATIVSYSLLVGILGLTWFRLWQSLRIVTVDWRRPTFIGCLGAFLVLPVLFTILMATAAPEVLDPKTTSETAFNESVERNLAFSNLWLGLTQTLMAAAFCGAVALPHIGDLRRAVPLAARPAMAVAPASPPSYRPFR